VSEASTRPKLSTGAIYHSAVSQVNVQHGGLVSPGGSLRRYFKGSIILTTKRGIASWEQSFDDPIVAAAMLDRLLHHAREARHLRPALLLGGRIGSVCPAQLPSSPAPSRM
jgi:hypothetical protein